MLIKFKCKHCKSKKYDVVYWKKCNKIIHKGIYCDNCKKYFRFLSKNDTIKGKSIVTYYRNTKNDFS